MRRVRKVWIPGMLDARERRMNRFAPGFDPQPRLASDLVALRPLTAADFEALFAVASDPEIWALHPAHNRWQELVFRRFFDDALASGGALVAVDPATGAVIGSSRYDTGRADPGEVEIGWTFLARRYWGGAVNGAMKSLMIAHALESHDRVIFLVGEHNLRSRRALEKIGAVLTDRVQQAEMAGATVTHVIYAMGREAFERSSLSR
jgi:N-acetyltransferase